MDLKEIRATAREKLKGFCRVCPVCDGRACAGEVPGMGGVGTGKAFQENLRALSRYKLNLRTIHGVKEPDLSFELFGVKVSMPVFAAPITGTTYNMGGALTDEEYSLAVVEGSLLAGTLAFTGDGADPTMYGSGLKAIKKVEGKGIPIIKPRAQEEIIKRIREAEETGAIAVGVDIDGAGLLTMALKGQPVSPKTLEEVMEIVNSTRLPFILKGIMTPDEAELAVQAGAKAIVVSNHGGRTLDETPGAADVLPEIAARVKGKITILADGGVRSGVDVLKLLALGADGVLIGRPIIVAAFGGGAEGVKIYLEKIKKELREAMLLTGVARVTEVPGTIIRKEQ
ncbi:alpha-hydroxy-acid oxidizing protein [Carboxydothermus hydrogenoformans]|uniref:L-lactate oxidase n=1 Tax=Carboxydothermus hydrogenoformans (strain ATCC BAA-161 / DSM 6008 / Z-2901) TaxID=246194 RepID=Q3ACI1_CARHZ|nr:alpha-hydroxy-acid oxidizing protein [Carboxydothermus hydrogenoformans]ABB15754.1 dehydrogenase, FMN-dependent family [Carboxydothermus hydrogenoformans Z-2901]